MSLSNDFSQSLCCSSFYSVKFCSIPSIPVQVEYFSATLGLTLPSSRPNCSSSILTTSVCASIEALTVGRVDCVRRMAGSPGLDGPRADRVRIITPALQTERGGRGERTYNLEKAQVKVLNTGQRSLTRPSHARPR